MIRPGWIPEPSQSNVAQVFTELQSMQQPTSGAERPDTAYLSDKRPLEGLQHAEGRPSKRVCAQAGVLAHPEPSQQQQDLDASGRGHQAVVSNNPQHHQQELLQSASSGQQLGSAVPAGRQDLLQMPWFCQLVDADAAATVRVMPRIGSEPKVCHITRLLGRMC